MIVLFILILGVLAEWEPYTEACFELATAQHPWPAQDHASLCELPEFRFLANECMLRATATEPRAQHLRVCDGDAAAIKTIGISMLTDQQIKRQVAFTAAMQSVDATKLSRKRADSFSQAAYLYWVCLASTATVLNTWLWLSPRSYFAVHRCKATTELRKRLMFGDHNWLNWFMLAGFVVVNITALFSDLPIVMGHVSLPSYHLQRLKHIADRAAYWAAKTLPVAVFLGGRSALLMTLTGWDINRHNILHRWLGRIAMANFILHGLCYASLKLAMHSYGAAMQTRVFQLGTVALIMLLLLFVQSLRVLRRQNYEVFIALHVALWLAASVVAYFHTRNMAWGSNCFVVAALVIWAVDRGARLAKIGLNGCAKRGTVVVHDNGVVRVSLAVEGREDHCGTFAFVHFLNLHWWQSHPFSYYCDGEQMHFMVAPRAGETHDIKRLTLYRAPRVLVDGPYGTRPNLSGFASVVFVAGGIGVTATIGYLRTLHRTVPNTTVTLHWAVRSYADLEMVDWLLQSVPGNTLVTVYVHTGRKLSSVESLNESVESYAKDYYAQLHYCLVKSRLSVHEVVASHCQSAWGVDGKSVAVVVCGPEGMVSDARRAVRDSIDGCGNYVELFEHLYSW